MPPPPEGALLTPPPPPLGGDAGRDICTLGASRCRTIGGLIRRGSLLGEACGDSIRDSGTLMGLVLRYCSRTGALCLGGSACRAGAGRSADLGVAGVEGEAGADSLPCSNLRQPLLSLGRAADGAAGVLRAPGFAPGSVEGLAEGRTALPSLAPPKRRQLGLPPSAGEDGLTTLPCGLAGTSARAAGADGVAMPLDPDTASVGRPGAPPPNARRAVCSMLVRCWSKGTRSTCVTGLRVTNRSFAGARTAGAIAGRLENRRLFLSGAMGS